MGSGLNLNLVHYRNPLKFVPGVGYVSITGMGAGTTPTGGWGGAPDIGGGMAPGTAAAVAERGGIFYSGGYDPTRPTSEPKWYAYQGGQVIASGTGKAPSTISGITRTGQPITITTTPKVTIPSSVRVTIPTEKPIAPSDIRTLRQPTQAEIDMRRIVAQKAETERFQALYGGQVTMTEEQRRTLISEPRPGKVREYLIKTYAAGQDILFGKRETEKANVGSQLDEQGNKLLTQMDVRRYIGNTAIDESKKALESGNEKEFKSIVDYYRKKDINIKTETDPTGQTIITATDKLMGTEIDKYNKRVEDYTKKYDSPPTSYTQAVTRSLQSYGRALTSVGYIALAPETIVPSISGLIEYGKKVITKPKEYYKEFPEILGIAGAFAVAPKGVQKGIAGRVTPFVERVGEKLPKIEFSRIFKPKEITTVGGISARIEYPTSLISELETVSRVKKLIGEQKVATSGTSITTKIMDIKITKALENKFDVKIHTNTGEIIPFNKLTRAQAYEIAGQMNRAGSHWINKVNYRVFDKAGANKGFGTYFDIVRLKDTKKGLQVGERISIGGLMDTAGNKKLFYQMGGMKEYVKIIKAAEEGKIIELTTTKELGGIITSKLMKGKKLIPFEKLKKPYLAKDITFSLYEEPRIVKIGFEDIMGMPKIKKIKAPKIPKAKYPGLPEARRKALERYQAPKVEDIFGMGKPERLVQIQKPRIIQKRVPRIPPSELALKEITRLVFEEKTKVKTKVIPQARQYLIMPTIEKVKVIQKMRLDPVQRLLNPTIQKVIPKQVQAQRMRDETMQILTPQIVTPQITPITPFGFPVPFIVPPLIPPKLPKAYFGDPLTPTTWGKRKAGYTPSIAALELGKVAKGVPKRRAYTGIEIRPLIIGNTGRKIVYPYQKSRPMKIKPFKIFKTSSKNDMGVSSILGF